MPTRRWPFGRRAVAAPVAPGAPDPDRYPTIHERLAIYAHLRALPDDAVARVSLPDEREDRDASGVRWAPGALDGVISHHTAPNGADPADAAPLVAAIALASREPTGSNLRALYALVQPAPARTVTAPLVQALSGLQADRAEVGELATWLAATAPDREPVKIATTLVGIAGLDDRALEVLRAIGRHDEFTLAVADAYRNGLADPEPELFDLARRVHGWGRIHLVERLANTTDPRILDWILLEGYRNDVTIGYLAHLAVTVGDLAGRLTAPQPSRALLDAAQELIVALLDFGPAGDIRHVDDGADAIQRYVGHLEQRAETLGDAYGVLCVEQFVTGTGTGPDIDDAPGWTEERRASVGLRCHRILDDPRWPRLVDERLRSGDRGERWMVAVLAPRLGVDTWPHDRVELARDPAQPVVWQQAFATRSAAEVVDLAESVLPLDTIGTGPADDLGLGPDFDRTSSINLVLQRAGDCPGHGGALVVAALQSPVVSNRNGAVNVLKRWPRSAWPAAVEPLVARAAAGDPHESVRKNAQELRGR